VSQATSDLVVGNSLISLNIDNSTSVIHISLGGSYLLRTAARAFGPRCHHLHFLHLAAARSAVAALFTGFQLHQLLHFRVTRLGVAVRLVTRYPSTAHAGSNVIVGRVCFLTSTNNRLPATASVLVSLPRLLLRNPFLETFSSFAVVVHHC